MSNEMVMDNGYVKFSDQWWSALAQSLAFLPEDQRMNAVIGVVMTAFYM